MINAARAVARVRLDEETYQHTKRVVAQTRSYDEELVAWLHDVLEDNRDLTVQHLREIGFTPNVVEAVRCLTRQHSTHDYQTYIAYQVAPNPLARQVKLYDLADNLERCAQPGGKAHLRERYLEAQRILNIWNRQAHG